MKSVIQFWSKLNLVAQVVFIFFVITIVLSIIGFANYVPPQPNTQEDNSELINRITNKNPVLSYPVSYSPIWEGSISVVPNRVRELDYVRSSTEECLGIVENMDVYFTPNLNSLMVITNFNLQLTSDQQDKFNLARQLIKGELEFNKVNVELETFRTYCSFFTLQPVSDLAVDIENVDSAKAIFGIGLRQDTPKRLEEVGLYLYIYAAKDDYLIQMSKSLRGDFLFSQSNWESCNRFTLQSDLYNCLKNIYSRDLSMQPKLEQELKILVDLFKF